MMKKPVVFICFIVLVTIPVVGFADVVDYETAIKVAQVLIDDVSSKVALESGENPDVLIYDNTYTISRYTVLKDENDLGAVYIYYLNPKGMVIVSGESRVEPILGFNFTDSYPENLSDEQSIRIFSLTNVMQAINTIRSENSEPEYKITSIWNTFINDDRTKATSIEPKYIIDMKVPLITTEWDQGIYYNAMCPYDLASGSYYDHHVPAGCGAIAAAQLMRYYKYPETGIGYHEYDHSVYGTLSVDTTARTYDWESMPDIVTDYNDDVAQLISDVGIGMSSNYGADSTTNNFLGLLGALYELYDYTVNFNMIVMKTDDGKGDFVWMSDDAEYNVNKRDWEDVLRSNIRFKRPVLYATSNFDYSQSDGGGHWYLIDGYFYLEYKEYR